MRWVPLGIPVLVSSVLGVVTNGADDRPGLTSGLQVGETASPFDVQDITGPNKGRTLCYYCMYGPSPVVCIVARETSETLSALVKEMDAAIAKNSELHCFVVVLSHDPKATGSKLKRMAQECNIRNVPLTLINNPAGPSAYKIAKDAEVTVMLWRGSEVKVNHAYKKQGLTLPEVRIIVSELPIILSD